MVGTRTVLAPAGFVPRQALSFGAEGGAATAVDPNNPLPVSAPPATLTDKTVTLSAAQAAGTAAVIAANPARRYFAITPASDGRLYITSGGTGFFYVLYAGVTITLTGADCPTNALYATGQAAGAALPMAEG